MGVPLFQETSAYAEYGPGYQSDMVGESFALLPLFPLFLEPNFQRRDENANQTSGCEICGYQGDISNSKWVITYDKLSKLTDIALYVGYQRQLIARVGWEKSRLISQLFNKISTDILSGYNISLT